MELYYCTCLLTVNVGLAVEGLFVGLADGLAVEGLIVGFADGIAVEGLLVGLEVT